MSLECLACAVAASLAASLVAILMLLWLQRPRSPNHAEVAAIAAQMDAQSKALADAVAANTPREDDDDE